MLTKFFLACSAFLCVHAAFAQTLDDALRLSAAAPLGTARSLGVGNSMSALGAEWTAVSSNPAGLAAYRRNEFTITGAGIQYGSKNTSLDGGPSTSGPNDFKLALPQIGLVLTHKPIASRWKQINFGIGASQINRFEEGLNYSGLSSGSVSDLWLDEANLYGLRPGGYRDYEGGFLVNPRTVDELPFYSSFLAFQAGILTPSDDTNAPAIYDTDYDFMRPKIVLDNGDTTFGPGAQLAKTGGFERTGRNSSIDFSVAGNFDEKLMFGATLALTRTRYESTETYAENDVNNQVDLFERITYRQVASVEGSGIQGRLGLIYRPMQALRIGLAYHTPSRISLTDSYNADVRYVYRDQSGATVNGFGAPEQASVLEYVYNTPSQYRFSVAGLIGKSGFVSGELGYINYAGGKFKIADGQDENINSAIKESYVGAVQARVGGELNVKPFQVRAGLQYAGAAIENEDATLGLSGGLGFRQNRLSLDAGYQYTIQPDKTFTPYNVVPTDFPQPTVNYTPSRHTFALTLGWKLVRLE